MVIAGGGGETGHGGEVSCQIQNSRTAPHRYQHLSTVQARKHSWIPPRSSHHNYHRAAGIATRRAERAHPSRPRHFRIMYVHCWYLRRVGRTRAALRRAAVRALAGRGARDAALVLALVEAVAALLRPPGVRAVGGGALGYAVVQAREVLRVLLGAVRLILACRAERIAASARPHLALAVLQGTRRWGEPGRRCPSRDSWQQLPSAQPRSSSRLRHGGRYARDGARLHEPK
eukprot:scaffold122119_cov60-Phaeocystis_antarctica.AAC.2